MQENKYKKWCGDGHRQTLKDKVPLDTPISVVLEASGCCNFKCRYCLRQTEVGGGTYNSHNMSLELFDKVLNDLSAFPNKITALNISGIGEPLLNKNLPEIVKNAKSSELFGSIKIITNGSLLNEDLSEKLIEAGLDDIRISLQGLDSNKVYETCGCQLDVEKLKRQISYFYNNKKDCKVYVKIMDCCLDELNTKEEFYKQYQDKCDYLFVEHMIDHFDTQVNENRILNMMQEESAVPQICSFPFWQLNIDSSGSVYPCCSSFGTSLSMGNINSKSIIDIWNGEIWRELRLKLLDGYQLRNDIPSICEECYKKGIYACGMQIEDSIDEAKSRLKDYYERQRI